MKYIIFLAELIAMVAWLVYGPSGLVIKALGIIGIIILSQVAHQVLDAR